MFGELLTNTDENSLWSTIGLTPGMPFGPYLDRAVLPHVITCSRNVV